MLNLSIVVYLNMEKMHDIFNDTKKLTRAKLSFYDRFDVGEKDKCWPWKGQLNDQGYGILSIGRKNKQRAHRFMVSVIMGSAMSDDLKVLHLCDNPQCVNPNHLKRGTQKENILDCISKNRNSKPPVKYGEKHHNTKFNSGDILKIKSDKRRYAAIAKDYGVCTETIGRVKRNQTWKNENVT